MSGSGPAEGLAVVTAVGADRPGIVAAVAAVLTEAGCNLEDSAMTILQDHFAMMLVVAMPRELGLDALTASVEAVGRSEDLMVSVRPLARGRSGTGRVADDGGRDHRLSVYGADHPGIVSGVAGLLAERGVNIVDLSTRVIGSREHPVYAMFMDLVVPAEVSTDDLDAALRTRAGELGVECELAPVETDLL